MSVKFAMCERCNRPFKFIPKRTGQKETCTNCGHRQSVNPKYGAKAEKCKLGHQHRSGMESEYCAILETKRRAGIVKEFVFEKSYILAVEDFRCQHFPDFTVHLPAPEGQPDIVEVHEVKGFEKAEWRLKRALFRVLYPEIKYVTLKKVGGKWQRR